MTRVQYAEHAIARDELLEFDYMALGAGRAAIERRVAKPYGITEASSGKTLVLAVLEPESEDDPQPRSFRAERMFNVTPIHNH